MSVTESRGRLSTTAVIVKKSMEELQKAVSDYLARYPQNVYETKVLDKEEVEGGMFRARLTRYTSSD